MNKGTVSDPPLRKNWRFQLIWAGAAVSNLGQSAVMLALPILILASTGSPVLAGLAASVSLATSILVGIPAGVQVDRVDRRKVLLLAQATQPLIWGSFAVLVYADALSLWNVLLVSVLNGAVGAFVVPAHAAALQAMVPKSQLATAHAQGQARGYAVQLAGPPLGGLLYAVSRVVPFVFLVGASLVAMLCYFAARVPRRPLDEVPHTRAKAASRVPLGSRVKAMKDDFVVAFKWLLAQRGLRIVVGVAIFLNPLVNAIWVPIIVLVNERGGGSFETGVIMAGVGIGGLLGAVLSARLSRLLPTGKLVLVVAFVMGFSYCLIPLPLGMLWPMIPLILACLAAPALNVATMTLLGHIVPSSMMGRMASMINLTFQGTMPLGPVIGGVLAASLGGSGAMVASGASLLVVGIVAAASPALRSLRLVAAPDPTPAQVTPVAKPQSAQLGDDTVRHLNQVGVIASADAPVAAVLSTLSAEETAFLASLSARIKAAPGPAVPEPEVVAHGEGGGDSTDLPTQ